jgi:hypothetical protein
MNNSELIRKTYRDPKIGFLSVDKLYMKIKELYSTYKITKKEIDKVIKEESTHQIHNQQKINPNDYNQITAKKIGFFQMDICDLSSYKSHNNGYRYILILVDIVSRYGFMEPMKTKSASEVYQAFMKIHYACETEGNPLYATYSDQDSGFSKIEKNQHKFHYKMFFKQTKSYRGTGIVDARIKFLRSILEKHFTQSNSLNWINDIEKINININNTENKTIKEPPIKIWEGKVKSKQVITENKPIDKFKVGMFIRVKNIDTGFSKTSTGIYSNKVYEIKEIDGLGMYVNGLSRKLFPVDVKLVKNGESLEKIDELRNKNKKIIL